MTTATDQKGLVDKLAGLGFTAAAERISRLQKFKRKMAIAYEFYKFVKPEKIDEYKKKLHKSTFNKRDGSYKALAFTDIGNYPKVPPAAVLDKLAEAIERKCFDSYEVAHIVNVADPLLFGRIEKCADRFFIAQWGDDVKLEDILSKNEG